MGLAMKEKKAVATRHACPFPPPQAGRKEKPASWPFWKNSSGLPPITRKYALRVINKRETAERPLFVKSKTVKVKPPKKSTL
jgi:hypothetical protein